MVESRREIFHFQTPVCEVQHGSYSRLSPFLHQWFGAAFAVKYTTRMQDAPKLPSLFWKWLPLCAAAGVLASGLLYTRELPTLDLRHLTYLVISFTWAATAVALRISGSDGAIAVRLQGVGPWKRVLLAAAAGAFLHLGFRGHFNYNLIPLAGLTLYLCAASKKPVFAFVTLLLVGCVMLGLVEGALTFVRHTPSLVQVATLRDLIAQLYRRDWNVLQFLPECTQFDEELGYTMRPGSCVFSNTEFSTTINVNSLGLRDHEESLGGPEVIALGDSFTTGWGVEDDESYPNQIEQLSGMKILNAGIATYGTAREFALLNRIDRSNLKYLIVQYCSNDFEENRAFQRSGRLPSLSRAHFEGRVAQHRQTHQFLPWRYTYSAYHLLLANRLVVLLRGFGWPPPAPTDFDVESEERKRPDYAQSQVDAFLNVLEKSPATLTDVHVIVTQISGLQEFLPLVETTLAEAPNSIRAASVTVVDVESRLDTSHRFPVDNHLNVPGNKRVAEILTEVLRAIEEKQAGRGIDLVPKN